VKNIPSLIFRLIKHRPLPFIPLCTINVQSEAQGTSCGAPSTACASTDARKDRAAVNSRDRISTSQVLRRQIGIASDD